MMASQSVGSVTQRPGVGRLTPWPSRRGAFAGRCSFITSLSPNPARLARQLYCVQSWLDVGVDVICVNTPEEIASLYFPPGVVVVASSDLSSGCERKTQRISALINVGIETGKPFFLINSDIEVHGHTEVIQQALDASDKLTIGIRYNYDGEKEAEREQWGLDLFGMTPELAKTLPSMSFGIGLPVWDYWVPYHFRCLKVAFHWINFPFLFHQSHAVHWSQADWRAGADALRDEYGFCLVANCGSFRRGLGDGVKNLAR